jgi:hypothetical protein
MKRLVAIRCSLFAVASLAACAANTGTPEPAPAPSVDAPIVVPDHSFDILVAAADSVLPRFGAPDEKFFINDSLVARVLDRIGASGRYTQIARDRQVSCDGSTDLTGRLATMRIYGIYEDSAAVAWSSTCMQAPQPGVKMVAVGGGGTYNLQRAGDIWVVSGARLFFEF